MPLPRFRLRTLMIAVMVAAMALYRLHLSRLRRDYQAIAATHVQRGQLFVLTPVMHASRGLTFRVAGSDSRRRQEYHAQLRRKYERAARHPWLPVPPDPPAPR